jgi:hypothetical protein
MLVIWLGTTIILMLHGLRDHVISSGSFLLSTLVLSCCTCTLSVPKSEVMPPASMWLPPTVYVVSISTILYCAEQISVSVNFAALPLTDFVPHTGCGLCSKRFMQHKHVVSIEFAERSHRQCGQGVDISTGAM